MTKALKVVLTVASWIIAVFAGLGIYASVGDGLAYFLVAVPLGAALGLVLYHALSHLDKTLDELTVDDESATVGETSPYASQPVDTLF